MMKKFFKVVFATLSLVIINSAYVKADNSTVESSTPNQSSVDSNNVYAFHSINKNVFDSESMEYKILGYQFLENPRPSANKNARYILIKCQLNTDDLDRDEAENSFVDDDFLKVYDNNSEATNINDLLSKQKLKQAPFNNVRKTLSKVQMGRTYEFDIGAVVYPGDNIELRLELSGGDNGLKIPIHQTKSSNGITMDDQDPMANYKQGEN